MSTKPLSVRQGVFRHTTIAVAVLGLCGALLCGAASQDIRTWSDSTGKFTIRAKFLE